MSHLASLLTGANYHEPRDELDAAVVARFAEILPGLVRREEGRAHGYVYDGRRCKPENMGWRLRQSFGSLDPAEVLAGDHDDKIEANWHQSANAEHYYMYEKDWG